MLKLYVQTIALLMAFACVGACEAKPPFDKIEATTGTLDLPNGSLCSATAIGPHVIATAGHCVEAKPVEVRFRGVNMRVVSITLDGRDHAFVRVDADVAPFAHRGPPAKRADTVWVIGNPQGLAQVLRQGFVAKVEAEQTYLDCRCSQGDSGAGIFNDKGELVAIFTGEYHFTDSTFTFPAFWPWMFTEAQWREARS